MTFRFVAITFIWNWPSKALAFVYSRLSWFAFRLLSLETLINIPFTFQVRNSTFDWSSWILCDVMLETSSCWPNFIKFKCLAVVSVILAAKLLNDWQEATQEEFWWNQFLNFRKLCQHMRRRRSFRRAVTLNTSDFVPRRQSDNEKCFTLFHTERFEEVFVYLADNFPSLLQHKFT